MAIKAPHDTISDCCCLQRLLHLGKPPVFASKKPHRTSFFVRSLDRLFPCSFPFLSVLFAKSMHSFLANRLQQTIWKALQLLGAQLEIRRSARNLDQMLLLEEALKEPTPCSDDDQNQQLQKVWKQFVTEIGVEQIEPTTHSTIGSIMSSEWFNENVSNEVHVVACKCQKSLWCCLADHNTHCCWATHIVAWSCQMFHLRARSLKVHRKIKDSKAQKVLSYPYQSPATNIWALLHLWYPQSKSTTKTELLSAACVSNKESGGLACFASKWHCGTRKERNQAACFLWRFLL